MTIPFRSSQTYGDSARSVRNAVMVLPALKSQARRTFHPQKKAALSIKASA
jgi:hypothetical protein